MKRYLVFAYMNYYPNGGWDDLSGSFDTIPEALAHLNDVLDRDAQRAKRDAWPDGKPYPQAGGAGFSDPFDLDTGYVVDSATGKRLGDNEADQLDPYRQIETLKTIIRDLHAIMHRERWQA